MTERFYLCPGTTVRVVTTVPHVLPLLELVWRHGCCLWGRCATPVRHIRQCASLWQPHSPAVPMVVGQVPEVHSIDILDHRPCMLGYPLIGRPQLQPRPIYEHRPGPGHEPTPRSTLWCILSNKTCVTYLSCRCLLKLHGIRRNQTTGHPSSGCEILQQALLLDLHSLVGSVQQAALTTLHAFLSMKVG